jgi:hypothetical protein
MNLCISDTPNFNYQVTYAIQNCYVYDQALQYFTTFFLAKLLV